MHGLVQGSGMGTSIGSRALEGAPLAVVAAASAFAAAMVWPDRLSGAFVFCVAFPLVVTVASGAMLLHRGARHLGVLLVVGMPIGNGCAGCVGSASFWNPWSTGDAAVVVAFLVGAFLLPTAIASARVWRAPAGSAPRCAASRSAWRVAGLTMALGTALLWVPPEAVLPNAVATGPSFEPVWWTPSIAWRDAFRTTAAIAKLVVTAGVVAVLVVAALDLRDLGRVQARRAGAPPAPTPYRTAPPADADAWDATLRAARRTAAKAVACLALAACASVYLAARVDHLDAGLDVRHLGEAPGRSVLVPSVARACQAVQPGDSPGKVSAHFRETFATTEWPRVDIQRWTAGGASPACLVRYRDATDWRSAVVSAELVTH